MGSSRSHFGAWGGVTFMPLSHLLDVPETSFHNHKAGKVTQPLGPRGESEEHEVQGTGLASLAGTVRRHPLLPASQEPPLLGVGAP